MTALPALIKGGAGQQMVGPRTLAGYDRVIDHNPAKGDLDGLVVQNITATGLARGFAEIRGDSHGGKLIGIKGIGIPYPDATHIPEGIGFNDTAHDWLVQACVMIGMANTVPPGGYQNGDGFASELLNRLLQFVGSFAYSCGNAGFDLKSLSTTLTQCGAFNCNFGLRVWGQTTLQGYFRSEGTKEAHFNVVGGRADGQPVVLDARHAALKLTGPAPIGFLIQGGLVDIYADTDTFSAAGLKQLVHETDGGKANMHWSKGEPKL